MKAFVKIITSLVVFVSVFLFLFLFSIRHSSLIDSKYYQPSVVSPISSNLEKVVSDFEEWQEVLRQSFKSFSDESVVKRCMSQNQTDGDIALREKTSAQLMLSLPSMQGIRVIEKETKRIHFSTFSTDVISKSDTTISYAKYGKNTLDIPYDVVEVASGNNKPCVDVLNNTFIFVQPFYDDYNVERGKIFFYVSAKSFASKLINEKRLSLTEEIHLLTDDNLNFIGILLGLPYEDSSSLKEEVLKEWKIGESNISQISNKEVPSCPFWVLVTYKKMPYYVGRICDKNMFVMPMYARYFLITVVSLIAFLITFLLLNIRQDRFVVARKKIQKLHANIIVDILKSVESLDDEKLLKKIEYRRHDANAKILKALGKKISQKYETEVSAILEQSWTRIIQVIGAKTNNAEELTHKNKDDEILKILKELQRGVVKTKVTTQNSESHDETNVEEIEEVQELEELGGDENDGQLVEELEEVVDFEGLDEIEDLESVGEAVDEVEELEEIEEFDEVEAEQPPLQEPEVSDEIEELEEVLDDENCGNELDEVQGLEEVQESERAPDDIKTTISEIQKTEEVEELEEVEAEQLSLEEPEVLDELEEVEDFEEVGVEDFVTMEETSPPSRPKFEEVDDYIESDDELFNSQSEQAEDRFRHIDIGGLDFSYLDDKKDEQKPLSLLEVKNAWVENPIPDDRPIEGELEVIGDAEPFEVESLEEAIVSKDGIYTISELEKPEPSDMEFKNLVESVINKS